MQDKQVQCPRRNRLRRRGRIVKADTQRSRSSSGETLTGVEVLIFTGTQSRHVLMEAYHSPARGCLLKSEGPGALLPALESIRHHHRFRSHGITEVCDDISANIDKFKRLTPREREIACLLARGASTSEVAVKLGVSPKTIDTHRANIYAKLQVHSVAELVRYALRVGLVEF